MAWKKGNVCYKRQGGGYCYRWCNSNSVSGYVKFLGHWQWSIS